MRSGYKLLLASLRLDGKKLKTKMIWLGFPIFRKVQDNYRFGGFETHRSGFKSKEMNPATLAP